ncbi:MAG TPA: sodium:proton antiporter [Chromatiales bacterium]|nr:sodium:proton antiporter [Chromatiales bacterium]
MDLVSVISVLLTIAALFGYLNERYVHLPSTIGLMLIALVMSLGLIVLGRFGLAPGRVVREFLTHVDFNQALMHGMLSFLLFAGALHVNLEDLNRNRWTVGLLATGGVIVSTALIGVAGWWLFGMLGVDLPLLYCLVFGALISPTDPIAVLAVLKSVGVSRDLEAKIAGESLFNDGVGVVVFVVLLGIAAEGGGVRAGDIALLFVREALGGAVFGLGAGYLAYRMLKGVDNYSVEVLITLALVAGGYALADHLHLSGPIAIVVAGLLIGNHGRLLAMSSATRAHLDSFWELIDETLNAVLFVLIGLEVLVLTFTPRLLLAGALMIPLVLVARFVSVGLPVRLLGRAREFSPHAIPVLTWGGLRGGISVALALSVPVGPERPVILAVTYIVVVFSILVQGLTVGRLARAAGGGASG